MRALSVGRLDGRTVGRPDGRTVGRSDGRMVRRMDGWSDGRLVGRSEGRMVGWSDGRMDGRSDGRTLYFCFPGSVSGPSWMLLVLVLAHLKRIFDLPATNLIRIYLEHLGPC